MWDPGRRTLRSCLSRQQPPHLRPQAPLPCLWSRDFCLKFLTGKPGLRGVIDQSHTFSERQARDSRHPTGFHGSVSPTLPPGPKGALPAQKGASACGQGKGGLLLLSPLRRTGHLWPSPGTEAWGCPPRRIPPRPLPLPPVEPLLRTGAPMPTPTPRPPAAPGHQLSCPAVSTPRYPPSGASPGRW